MQERDGVAAQEALLCHCESIDIGTVSVPATEWRRGRGILGTGCDGKSCTQHKQQFTHRLPTTHIPFQFTTAAADKHFIATGKRWDYTSRVHTIHHKLERALVLMRVLLCGRRDMRMERDRNSIFLCQHHHCQHYYILQPVSGNESAVWPLKCQSAIVRVYLFCALLRRLC